MDETIEERFKKFHAANPRVYKTLVQLARRAVNAGRTKGAIGMLWEVLRWELYLETTDASQSEFKLNDHYRSRYARMIMDQEPDLVGFFEIRRLRAE